MTTLKQILEKNMIKLNITVSETELLIISAKEWLQQKPSDYTVNYVDDTPPTHYLNKEKLLEDLETEKQKHDRI